MAFVARSSTSVKIRGMYTSADGEPHKDFTRLPRWDLDAIRRLLPEHLHFTADMDFDERREEMSRLYSRMGWKMIGDPLEPYLYIVDNGQGSYDLMVNISGKPVTAVNAQKYSLPVISSKTKTEPRTPCTSRKSRSKTRKEKQAEDNMRRSQFLAGKKREDIRKERGCSSDDWDI
ncbi:unnamed protein product [Amoebophrya sp. A25]|nr:unnamed protein product [Amoebophrya sp. A25]|eukprot:GSA25T00021248001.1